jgi:hypothetical protein
MEFFLRREWRPRLFWIVPVWTVGVAGAGAALMMGDRPIPGAALIGAGAVAFAIHVAVQSRKPGGRWVGVMVAAIVGILAETLAEQAVTSAKPWWGYAIRSALILGFVYALLQMWRERARAARTASARDEVRATERA